MIDLSRVEKYYVACGYTDLRRGIDGLAAIVSQQYGRDLCEDSLFLFCGRRTDRIKALYYSGDGYILLYKRLNNGAFQWPRTEQELRLLDARSFRWLMEGLKIDQPKAIQKEKSKETKIILYFPIILARRCIRRSKRAAKPRMMVHRHRVNGAAVPDVWCTAAVGMVHTAAARFHYSGIPLRLRMDSPSIWMV